MSKFFEEMTFDELRDHAAARMFDGLLTGGGKEFKAQVYLWLCNAIAWEKWQVEKTKTREEG